MNDTQQRQLIADIMGKAIDSGKIKFETPQIKPIIQEVQPKKPTYTADRVSFYDLLTCIMFTLNLLGETDINWFLVFLPFAFPYIVFYVTLWSVMLWAKIKNKKNNKENGETKAN